MLSVKASALKAAFAEVVMMFWCIVLLEIDDRGRDKVTEVLKVLECPGSPDRRGVFPLDFPEPLVGFTLLFNVDGFFVGFVLMFWVLR